MQKCDKDVMREYMDMAARAVAASAKSAPHTTGSLDLVINILSEEEIKHIQETFAGLVMQELKNVWVYDGMLTIGAKVTKSNTNWDCGACGFSTCAEMNKASKPKDSSGPRPSGPCCNWKVLDWSIALDYAAAMASYLGLQTRVQDIQGIIAKDLGYAGDVDVCTTVPLTAEKRNPHFGGRFDKVTKDMINMRTALTDDAIRRIFPNIMDLDMLDVLFSNFGLRGSPNLASIIEPGPQAAPQPASKEEE